MNTETATAFIKDATRFFDRVKIPRKVAIMVANLDNRMANMRGIKRKRLPRKLKKAIRKS